MDFVIEASGEYGPGVAVTNLYPQQLKRLVFVGLRLSQIHVHERRSIGTARNVSEISS